MSFKLFLYQLTGKLKSVETIETQRENLQKDYQVFEKVEGSEELKAFLELEESVNSEKFKQKKTEIEALQFKGSREYNQQNEFYKLKKSSPIKKYFKVIGSTELKRFNQLKNSDKLNEYYTLYGYVKEGQFEKDKREIKGQVFKGSVEEKHLKDFKRLEKSGGIKAWLELNGSEKLKKHKKFGESEKLRKFVTGRNAPDMDKQTKKEFRLLKRDSEIKAYFKFERSKKLRLFHETEGSHDLKKYFELKDYTEADEFKKREAFLKDNKKFENSEAYKKYKRFKSLSADADLKFFLKYEKSGMYKNYLDVKDSFDLKRYFELEEIINSEEYKKRKAYLQDKKKWEKTEEYAQLQKYREMKKLPHLVTYFKYKDSNAFDFLRNWKVTFEDTFTENSLNRDLWETKGFWSEKLLGENYSMPGDLHIVTDGGNVAVDKKLILEVKKEKTSGKIWKMPVGFMPVELDYTTGLVSSAKSFWIEDGILHYWSPSGKETEYFYLKRSEISEYLSLSRMRVGRKNNYRKRFEIPIKKEYKGYLEGVTNQPRAVRESVSFERGKDPKGTMEIGLNYDSLSPGMVIQAKKEMPDLEVSIGDKFYVDDITDFPGRDSKNMRFRIIEKDGSMRDWGADWEIYRDFFDEYLQIVDTNVVRESVSFERGKDPKKVMGIGSFEDLKERWNNLQVAPSIGSINLEKLCFERTSSVSQIKYKSCSKGSGKSHQSTEQKV